MEFNKKLDIAMEQLYKQGAFLTSKDNGKINTMTISWGSIGYMWRRPVFTVMVRPQRYTNEFIEKSKSFTVSIPFTSDFKKALGICGSKSGRNVDKEKEANIKFVDGMDEKFSVVDGCDVYYECNVLYSSKLKPEELPEELKNNFYNGEDAHILYFAEIVNCYEK